MTEFLQKLIDEYAAALMLGVKVNTLRRWRVKGSDLPFYRIGGKVRYSKEDISEYINKQKFYSTAQADQKK